MEKYIGRGSRMEIAGMKYGEVYRKDGGRMELGLK
jgi:hypothetical protein